MVFFTSICPGRIEEQKKAVESWLKTGSTAFSLNCSNEISVLRDLYPEIVFIPTNDVINGKYVRINAILNAAYSQHLSNEICIINSDIEITDNKKHFEQFEKYAKQSLVYVSRYDYSHPDKSDMEITPYGIDIFAFSKPVIKIYTEQNYAIGQPVWDYWLPYTALKNNIPLTYINYPFAFHCKHEKKWNHEQWERNIQALKDENKIVGVDRAISRAVRNIFIQNSYMLEQPV
jgi:hypothetical protein